LEILSKKENNFEGIDEKSTNQEKSISKNSSSEELENFETNKFEPSFDDFEGISFVSASSPLKEETTFPNEKTSDDEFNDFSSFNETNEDFEFEGTNTFEANFDEQSSPQIYSDQTEISQLNALEQTPLSRNNEYIQNRSIEVFTEIFGSFSITEGKVNSLTTLAINAKPSSSLLSKFTNCIQCGALMMNSCILCGNHFVKKAKGVIRKIKLPLSEKLYLDALKINFLEATDDIHIEDPNILQPSKGNELSTTRIVLNNSIEKTSQTVMEPLKPISLAANELDFLQSTTPPASPSEKLRVTDFFSKTLEDMGLPATKQSNTNVSNENKKDPLSSWINQKNSSSRRSQDLTAKIQEIHKLQNEVPKVESKPITSSVDLAEELLSKLPDLSFMVSTTLVFPKVKSF